MLWKKASVRGRGYGPASCMGISRGGGHSSERVGGTGRSRLPGESAVTLVQSTVKGGTYRKGMNERVRAK